MGQEILYCVACQTQLRGADFDKRRAVRVDGKGYCLPCGQKLFPPDRLAAPVSPSPPPPSTRLNIKPSTRRAPTPSGNRSLAIGGAAVLAAIGIGIAVLSGGSPPAPPPAIVPPPVAVKKAVDPAPQPLPDMGDVDAELRRLLPKEEFGQALRVIEAVRFRSTIPEWNRMVNQRSDDVHAQAERLLKDLKAKAVEAKRAGDPELPRKIHERMSAWDMPRAIPELEAALAAEPGPVTAKVLYSESFSAGRGRFEQGEIVDGALSFGPVGVGLGVPFPSPIQASSLFRFRIKPPPGVKTVQFVVWSNTLKANGWYHLGPFKAGEWQQVEVKASELRVGWNRNGAGFTGHTANSFRMQYADVPPETRVLIDDFQILE